MVREMESESNELKKKIEKDIVYKVYSANVPMDKWETQYPIVDAFCKDNFGDNRWTMIWTLVNEQVNDYKYALLYNKLMDLETEITEIKNIFKQQPKKGKEMKTFGQSKGGNENENI